MHIAAGTGSWQGVAGTKHAVQGPTDHEPMMLMIMQQLMQNKGQRLLRRCCCFSGVALDRAGQANVDSVSRQQTCAHTYDCCWFRISCYVYWSCYQATLKVQAKFLYARAVNVFSARAIDPDSTADHWENKGLSESV